MAAQKHIGCLPLWSSGCACIALLMAVISDPIGGPVLALLLWVLGVPVCFLIALVGVAKKAPKAKAARTPAELKAPTKKELAAQARQELDDAEEAAGFIANEDERESALAEARAKFRRRMGELLR